MHFLHAPDLAIPTTPPSSINDIYRDFMWLYYERRSTGFPRLFVYSSGVVVYANLCCKIIYRIGQGMPYHVWWGGEQEDHQQKKLLGTFVYTIKSQTLTIYTYTLIALWSKRILLQGFPYIWIIWRNIIVCRVSYGNIILISVI